MTLISRKYIEDHDIVARYLADQLSDTERERFEAYFLEHPELVAELNRAAQFKSGLMDLGESRELQKLLKTQLRGRPSNRIAIAASVLLVVIGGSIWFYLQNTARPILAASVTALTYRFQSTLPVEGSYNIQRTRTSSYDATIIKLPANSAVVELRIKPEARVLPSRYRISLGVVSVNDTITQLATLSDLQLAKDGFVPIYLNSSELSPAIYELKISADVDTNAASSTSSFLIEVLAPSKG